MQRRPILKHLQNALKRVYEKRAQLEGYVLNKTLSKWFRN